MDGGRRVLRSLKEHLSALFTPVHAHPAAAGAPAAAIAAPLFPARSAPPRPAPPRRGAALAHKPGAGLAATAALFALVGAAGFVENGGYAELVAREGEPRDILARAIGFPVSAVTITGQTELRETEILAVAGVGPRNSLLFLDASAVRERLLTVPLVKTARVAKLYPDRLVIALEERQPHALWQRDGHVFVVAADGTAIDELRDDRFLGLPFVVGEGAQMRLLEYASLLKGAGEIAPRVKAGVFVAGRRWTLEMTNGVSVKLPELEPWTALATLQRLQREARILDKDILSIDLRTPGRAAVRLTEEGLASREAALSRKSRKSGG
jgi:cell division protein FtsQ